MKIFQIIPALFMLFFLNVNGQSTNGNSTVSTGNLKTDLPVTARSVEGIMAQLTSDEMSGRASGEEGIEKAAAFIAGFFEENGIAPYYPEYRDTLDNVNMVTTNIVGWLEGNDPELKKEFIVLGAHYDHIGLIKPEGGDSIANGANDNASGTTAVMEIARAMAEDRSNKRSVIFALFAAEEIGLKGSYHMASVLKEKGVPVVSMVNFEMIGVPLDRDYLAYITGYEMSSMAAQMNAIAGEDLIGFLPQAKKFRLFRRSDNYPFYKTLGIPAQTVSTFDFTNFGFYHHVDDELEKMDMGHMADFINKMVPVVKGLVNGESVPVLHEEQKN